MVWFKKVSEGIRTESEPQLRKSVPEGVWERCPSCQAALYKPELEVNMSVCPSCSHHFRVNVRDRLAQLFDAETAT